MPSISDKFPKLKASDFPPFSHLGANIFSVFCVLSSIGFFAGSFAGLNVLAAFLGSFFMLVVLSVHMNRSYWRQCIVVFDKTGVSLYLFEKDKAGEMKYLLEPDQFGFVVDLLTGKITNAIHGQRWYTACPRSSPLKEIRRVHVNKTEPLMLESYTHGRYPVDYQVIAYFMTEFANEPETLKALFGNPHDALALLLREANIAHELRTKDATILQCTQLKALIDKVRAASRLNQTLEGEQIMNQLLIQLRDVLTMMQTAISERWHEELLESLGIADIATLNKQICVSAQRVHVLEARAKSKHPRKPTDPTN